ncbi:MAG: PAS domain S-box protein [Gemmatimonadota bacterium]|nr:PAS domain S-box protein [Gemmatimonadota bacterium]
MGDVKAEVGEIAAEGIGTHDLNPSRDLRQILSDLSAVVWEMDPSTWEFTYVSRYAERLLGFPIERWRTPGFWADRLHPDDRPDTLASCERAIESGEDHFLEYRMIAADGHTVWVRDSVRVCTDADGRANLVTGILFDITHLKQAEHSWKASEQRFNRFAEASTECVVLHDNGKILEVNEACARMFGYSAEEMIGLRAVDLAAEPDRARVLNNIATGSEEPLSGIALRKDGSTFFAELEARNLTLLGETVRVVTLRDISTRRRAEEALAAAEIDYQTICDEVTEAIVLTDKNLRLTRLNRSACVLAGMSEKEMLGRSLREFIDPRELAVNPLRLDRLEPGMQLRVERRLRSPEGEEMIADISAKRLPDGRVIASIHDLTQSKKAEADLRQSELLFEKAFQTSQDAVILFRLRDEKILDVNDAWVTATGIARENAIGRSQLDFNVWGSEEERGQFHAALLSRGVVRDFGFRFFDQRGAPRHGVMSAEVITMDGEACALVIGRDITEQMRLEQHVRQTQRLEAIGGVAGGIAHDFNNILTAIRAFSEMAIDSLPHSNPAREDVLEILKAADRAIALTRQLLTFSRQEVQNVRTISVNEVISDLAPMLRRLADEKWSLDLSLSDGAGFVNADPGQVQQVVMNLFVNARDAMPAGGAIRVETANAESTAPTPEKPDVHPGRFVSISISDTGVGIPESIRERMFEPFFTTKAGSGGTGLGLSTVYGIVKQSGGAIAVVSEAGKGSTFQVLLPRVDP